jgi:aryl carrier-like protein
MPSRSRLLDVSSQRKEERVAEGGTPRAASTRSFDPRADANLGTCADDDDPAGVHATLMELWRRLFREFHPEHGPAALGPDVDFFAAGGDSILAVMMLSGIYEEFGVNLSFHAMLEEPTIRGLGRRVIACVLADPPSAGAAAPQP